MLSAKQLRVKRDALVRAREVLAEKRQAIKNGSLVDRAKAVRMQRNNARDETQFNQEHVELAMAYAKGQVTSGQCERVLGLRSGTFYSWLRRLWVFMVENDMIVGYHENVRIARRR